VSINVLILVLMSYSMINYDIVDNPYLLDQFVNLCSAKKSDLLMRDSCLFSVGVTYLKIWENGGNIHESIRNVGKKRWN